MYLSTPYKISYDTQLFPFREIVMNMLGTDSLNGLHELEFYDTFTREKDQSTRWHKLYYDNFQALFSEKYRELVIELAERFNYSSIIYQKIPTFRVHLVNNVGVGDYHKDRTYNHNSNEVNFWMPFTNTYSTNTIWLESKEDKGDFRPYEVKYGEILVFNGADLMHGNQTNKTLNTRVSVDFRLVDPKKFSPSELGSININVKFDVGGYFEKMEL